MVLGDASLRDAPASRESTGTIRARFDQHQCRTSVGEPPVGFAVAVLVEAIVRMAPSSYVSHRSIRPSLSASTSARTSAAVTASECEAGNTRADRRWSRCR